MESSYQSGEPSTKFLNASVRCRISTAMSVQHVQLADVCSSRKRIFINAKTTAMFSPLLPPASLRRTLGSGSRGLIDPLTGRYSHSEYCQRSVSRSQGAGLQRMRLHRREQGCSRPGMAQSRLQLDLLPISYLVIVLNWRCCNIPVNISGVV